ncbi:peptidoglycan-binding protein [Streptomyces sp. 6N223]|uniref:peptidoglycan-binding protein n=1 Tax=Streptomyces sp. 6N223 TaxID=3457412 RepID=UPI003FD556DF
MRLRTALIALGAVAAVGAAGVAATGFGGGDATAEAEAPDGPPATTKVETATLTQTEEVSGTLGYGEALTLEAPAGTAGIITWLPEAGTVVGRGEPLYTVNAQPVPLLYGGAPLYRPLTPGTAGKDAQMLEANLAELGYTGFTPDDTYTEATADAVAEWQDDIGREETGVVGPGEVGVADGTVRLQQAHTAPGAPAGGPVMDVTGTGRQIDVDLEAGLEHLVEEGDTATVELPGGETVTAEITDVGTASAATSPEDAPPGGGAPGAEDAEVTIPLVLTVDGKGGQEALGDYQAAPVTVALRAETREDVLAVPVTALVALSGGGYGLEVVSGGASHYVAVETGMFASGMVEVSGEGIEEGTVVGVPDE